MNTNDMKLIYFCGRRNYFNPLKLNSKGIGYVLDFAFKNVVGDVETISR